MSPEPNQSDLDALYRGAARAGYRVETEECDDQWVARLYILTSPKHYLQSFVSTGPTEAEALEQAMTRAGVYR